MTQDEPVDLMANLRASIDAARDARLDRAASGRDRVSDIPTEEQLAEIEQHSDELEYALADTHDDDEPCSRVCTAGADLRDDVCTLIDALRVLRAENERLAEQRDEFKAKALAVSEALLHREREVERLTRAKKSIRQIAVDRGEIMRAAESERDALAAEVERLNGEVRRLFELNGRQARYVEELRKPVQEHCRQSHIPALAERDAALAVITRVREQAKKWSRMGMHGWSGYVQAGKELLALLDSPSTEETAECVNCGAPMPGRRPGDVCRDCQGSVPNTEEQRKKPRECPGDGCPGCEGCWGDPNDGTEEQTNG